MKKFMIFLLFIFFCFPIVANADGYIQEGPSNQTGTTTPPTQDTNDTEGQNNDGNIEGLLEDSNDRIRQYRSSIERQEVKEGNQKQGNILPLVFTIIVASCACGGYYYFKRIKANY